MLCITLIPSCSDKNEFSHCELTLVLEDGFSEIESSDFDLLLSNGDVAVSVNRISFAAGFNQGISDTYTAKGFAAFFMHQSKKSDELFMYGDVPYYTYTEKGENKELFYTVTFYRSKNAYFTVAYATDVQNKDLWSSKFLEFAENAYFNDASEINS